MNIFADYHHGGAARAQVLLFQARLGHSIYFGNTEFVKNLDEQFEMHHIQHHSGEGDWLPCISSWLVGMGGVPSNLLRADGTWENLISFEEFMDKRWDIFLTTRTETQEIFKSLKKIHPHGDEIKIIALTGNDAVLFDYDSIKNLMTSDEPTYNLAPPGINKIHYSQELGFQYGASFIPIGVHELKTINCFINCWPSFDQPWHWNYNISGNQGRCPNCNKPPATLPPAVKPYEIWTGASKLLPEYTFNDYGINCKIGCKPEVQLPLEYASGALTVHMKTYDGYGFSMLQSIACGRPVIVPRNFYKFRTANKYLIPNLTCFEADWNAESVAQIIQYVTETPERANEYAVACYIAGRGIFNWAHEAFRVKEFLGRLI